MGSRYFNNSDRDFHFFQPFSNNFIKFGYEFRIFPIGFSNNSNPEKQTIPMSENAIEFYFHTPKSLFSYLVLFQNSVRNFYFFALEKFQGQKKCFPKSVIFRPRDLKLFSCEKHEHHMLEWKLRELVNTYGPCRGSSDNSRKNLNSLPFLRK